ncbi:MAG: M3 family oligoendopeptidase [Acidobacteriota bacterium]
MTQATLTPETLLADHDHLAARVAQAEESGSPDAWLALLGDWNALKIRFSGERSRRQYRHDQDLTDSEHEAAHDVFRKEFQPVADRGNTTLIDALLASRHAEAIAARHGDYFLRRLRASRRADDPRNAERRIRVGDLCQDYERLVSRAEVTLDGETMTLARARSRGSSPDPEMRRRAFLAHRGWFRDHRDELDAIFDELVAQRDAMGRELGDSDYVALGHAGVNRTEYGAEESRQFREAVRTHASPLLAEIASRLAEVHGDDGLKPWNASSDPTTQLEPGAAEPIDEQVPRAERVFERLSPRLATHFARMREEGLIDLANRPGKRTGAYCMPIHDEKKVVILCNSVGDADDLRTLVHESGHAFQMWESQWIELVDLRMPSFDAAEVHSTAMESLVQPYLDEFLTPPQLDRYRREAARRGLELLCYACVVDAFQYWVYTHPGASAAERHAEWNELYQSFLPGVDWSGHEDLLSARWHAQGHVFRRPFYYLDYAIAKVGALQLARLSQQDHDGAMEAYHELCRLGGTKGVLDLFSAAGLGSPFDPEVIASCCDHARSELSRTAA